MSFHHRTQWIQSQPAQIRKILIRYVFQMLSANLSTAFKVITISQSSTISVPVGHAEEQRLKRSRRMQSQRRGERFKTTRTILQVETTEIHHDFVSICLSCRDMLNRKINIYTPG